MIEEQAPAAEVVEGAPEVLPPAEDTAKPEGATEEGKEGTPEGAISDADRTKYAIPAKFKDWNAVVKWGSEAEKAKSKAESEKGELEKKAKDYEEMLLETQSAKPDTSGLSNDEKTQMAAKFQEDFSTDPIGTMQKLFSEFENRIQTKQTQSTQVKKWEKEEADISSTPEYKEIWASEVKPELIKIAKERPHLTSLDELLAIYERNKGKASKFNKDDSDAKKAAKLAALAESGSGSGGISEDLMKKIASAKNHEELEKLASRIK